MSGQTTPPTDSIDTTDDAVAALQAEVDALRERVAELEQRLAEKSDPTTEDPREWLDVPADHRDAAVISTLTPGSVYRIHDLRAAYRRETDIRASETLADRVKTLLNAAAFERIGNNRRWRYQPPARDAGDDARGGER